MSRSRKRLLRSVAELGKSYHDEHLADSVKGRDALLSDWWSALLFWFNRSFYQGRRDSLSTEMKTRAVATLNNILGEELSEKRRRLVHLEKKLWLTAEGWEREGNPLQKALRASHVNKRGDRLLVISSLGLATELRDLNIVAWAVGKAQIGRISEAHRRLDDLHSVGEKIASVFLRDVVDVFDLRSFVSPDDAVLLQPVDTWVRQVAVKVELVDKESGYRETRQAIVAGCQRLHVDPIRFNQGAKYLGAHALDIALEHL
jgi:hypothetical protein